VRGGRRTAVRANSFPAKCRLTARDQDLSEVRVDEPTRSYIHADLKDFSAPILRNAPVGLPIPTVPARHNPQFPARPIPVAAPPFKSAIRLTPRPSRTAV
jgi:hypothetical protein